MKLSDIQKYVKTNKSFQAYLDEFSDRKPYAQPVMTLLNITVIKEEVLSYARS